MDKIFLQSGKKGALAAPLNDALQLEMNLFSLLISLDSTKFVVPRVFILIESAKSQLPVDVRRSKTPNYSYPSSRDDLTWLNGVNVL